MNKNLNNKTGKKSRSASKSAKSKSKQQKVISYNEVEDPARHVSLSKSVLDYSRSLANPFTGPNCGVPTYPSCISLKQKCWARGSCETGTSGLGFLVCSPEKMMFNNRNGVSFSVNTYAGTTIPADPSTASAGFQIARSNSQYADTSVGSSAAALQWRPVSCGIRIRYTGTELNRGGTLYALMDPNHDTLSGRSIADFNSEVTMVRLGVNREWATILWRPVRDLEFVYQTVVPTGNEYPMGFLIVSPSGGTSASYEYECFVNGEFQGANVRGQTPTSHDPTGFAAVNVSMQTSKLLQPAYTNSTTREGDLVGSVAKYLSTGISHVTPTSTMNVYRHHSAKLTSHSDSFLGAASEVLTKGIVPTMLSILPALF